MIRSDRIAYWFIVVAIVLALRMVLHGGALW